MTILVTESIWLNDTDVCSMQHLMEISGLSTEEIGDLIACGVLVPVETDAEPRSFLLRNVSTAMTARRLRDDFQLDRHGLSLALTLLRRIEELEARLHAAQAMRR